MTGTLFITLKGALFWCILCPGKLFRVYHKSQIELYNQQISPKTSFLWDKFDCQWFTTLLCDPTWLFGLQFFFQIKIVSFKMLLASSIWFNPGLSHATQPFLLLSIQPHFS